MLQNLNYLNEWLLTGASSEGNSAGEWAIALVVAGLYLEMVHSVCRQSFDGCSHPVSHYALHHPLSVSLSVVRCV
jgi:hypothetical protein